MKTQEIKKKSIQDLESILQRNREQLSQLRLDLASGKVKNVRKVRKLKKEIARILTIQKTLLKK